MKHLLIILFSLLLSTTSYARFGGSHSSSSHSTSHSSYHSTSHMSESHYGGHTTTTHISEGHYTETTNSYSHPYARVSHVSETEIHTYPSTSKNIYLYYYLLFNRNHNTYDTIKSQTKEDLINQVDTATSDDSPSGAGWVVIILIIALIIFLVISYLRNI